MRSRLALVLNLVVLIASGAQAQVRDTVGAPRPTSERTYFEFQVDQPARSAPGPIALRYPQVLLTAGVEGEVLVQFVVDTLGLPVLQTFRVLKASAPEFAVTARRSFDRLVDTTKVAPGVTTTCTPSQAP